MPCVQFPVETVREVAQILSQSGLGEVALETRDGSRLRLKRVVVSAPAAPLLSAAQVIEAQEEAEALVVAQEEQAQLDAQITVTSPAVGVWRDAKKPLRVGDEVSKSALLGAVETLNIPTELYAPQAARVVELLIAPGQGVEWGQPLLVLEPLETAPQVTP